MATTSIHSITATQVRTLAYISNESKTNDGTLIDSFMCSTNPDKAAEDFSRIQESMGTGRNKVLAQHIIQSFKPGEVTPDQAMELGKELCERLLKNEYQYMLAVHTDKQHIHCHIVFNNINMENGKTFEYLENRGNKKSWESVRKISDEICKKSGLSVIENPEKNKGKSWYEWDMNRQGQSWKSKLKFALDDCVMNSTSFEDFLKNVREKNIEVSYNPEHKIDLKFRMEGQEKWSRARTLGWYYETPQIKKRIEQYQLFKNGRSAGRQRTRIIDTSSEKFDNKGLERWADIQNMKEASKVINILTNLGVESTSDIEKKSLQSFGERINLVNDLNDIQHKIDELSETIKQVRIVKKYQPIRDEHKAQKTERKKQQYGKKYATELQKYKSAGAYLRTIYTDGNVPSEKELTAQRGELMEKRNSMNQEYKEVIKNIKDLDYARQTVEDYLSNERNEHKRKKGGLE